MIWVDHGKGKGRPAAPHIKNHRDASFGKLSILRGGPENLPCWSSLPEPTFFNWMSYCDHPRRKHDSILCLGVSNEVFSNLERLKARKNEKMKRDAPRRNLDWFQKISFNFREESTHGNNMIGESQRFPKQSIS